MTTATKTTIEPPSPKQIELIRSLMLNPKNSDNQPPEGWETDWRIARKYIDELFAITPAQQSLIAKICEKQKIKKIPELKTKKEASAWIDEHKEKPAS
jgi:hypothetical protein